MTDEIQSGAGVEDALPGTDPAAIGMALAGASREEADAFLKKQSSLIDIQKHHLREQFKHLSLMLWEKRMGVLLRIATAVMGLAVAAGLGFIVWQAAHANGLVIESFSVPPDLAARGLSGQVLAGQFSDKLSALQTATDSGRAARTFSNDWGHDITVEIPDTGISVSEAYRLLKSWLGNETHVSGDVWHTDTGIAVTARVSDGGGGAVFTGAENDLDSLVQKTAEDVYGRTQPYRYATYLLAKPGFRDQAVARLQTLATTGQPNDRGWAYMQWANALTDSGAPMTKRLFEQSQRYGIAPSFHNEGNIERSLGHPEQGLALTKMAEAKLRENGGNGFDPRIIPAQIEFYQSVQLQAMGAWREAAQAAIAAAEDGVRLNNNPYWGVAGDQINAHDVSGARKSLENAATWQTYSPVVTALSRLNLDISFAMAAEDWPQALASAEARNSIFQKNPSLAASTPIANLRQAYIEARLGKFAEAEALTIANTPGDCYECLRMRGQIAALQGQNARADWWFDRAVKAAPSIPFADYEWGDALMQRGDAAGAIAKFTLANQNGPHFADPLEGWGEALMAQNHSDLALAKFAEANKYAPNWGRLHLKWGEALVYAGKKDEAQKHFALAAGLDLTAVEISQLAHHL